MANASRDAAVQLRAILTAHALPWDAEGLAVARDTMREVGLDLPLAFPRRVRCPSCAGWGVREEGQPWRDGEQLAGPRPAEECPRCDGSGSEPYWPRFAVIDDATLDPPTKAQARSNVREG